MIRDKNNNIIKKTVFSGIKRNSLTWDDVLNLLNNEKHTQIIKSRFYRKMSNLSRERIIKIIV